jgi:hypothetical protein
MKIINFIKANREEILGRWRRLVLSSYSSQGASFMAGERDRFANPVGAAIDDVTSSLLEYLVEGVDENAYEESLERFIRIRAVQEYTASQAVGFIFSLKNAILESPGYALVARDESDGEFLVFNRIDRMALAAFDRYTACREKLYEIAMNEFKRRNHKIMERLGLSETAGDI